MVGKTTSKKIDLRDKKRKRRRDEDHESGVITAVVATKSGRKLAKSSGEQTKNTKEVRLELADTTMMDTEEKNNNEDLISHDLVEEENDVNHDDEDEVKSSKGDVYFEAQFNMHAQDIEACVKKLLDGVKPVHMAVEHPIIQKLSLYPGTRLIDGCDPSHLFNAEASLTDVHVKKRLQFPFEKMNKPLAKKALGKNKDVEDDTEKLDEIPIGTVMTSLQQHLFNYMNQYQDVLYGCNSAVFSKKSLKNADKEVRHTYCLHALNHVFKIRDRVLKNNAKLAALTSQKTTPSNDTIDEDAFRDQGFTRPKVLILVPFRNNALEIIETLIQLSGTSQQENKKRFTAEFSLPSEEDGIAASKPDDYKKLFAGNIDDCFRIGIKMARKQMKLFSEFYSSDIIIASPLGLKTIIGEEGDKKRDYDFLSSIELVIMDNAHVFLQQNWSHVQSIFKQMNLIPKESHGCDFSRVRNWYLDGRAKHVRQTLIFGDYLTPELNSVFNASVNVAGRIKVSRNWDGSLCRVLSQLPQLYQRLPPSSSVVDATDTRFKYFIDKVLPTLRKSITQQNHTLIVVPSYFDFVRVRNYLKEHNYNVGAISEYSSRSKVDQCRNAFAAGELPFLMMTERYHFFRRHRLKGVKHIVFYGPPVNAHFYSELLNRMAEEEASLQDQGDESASATLSSLVIFGMYDALALERLVGTTRVQRLLSGEKDSHLFTS